jgi:hypothetical protein
LCQPQQGEPDANQQPNCHQKSSMYVKPVLLYRVNLWEEQGENKHQAFNKPGAGEKIIHWWYGGLNIDKICGIPIFE